MKTDSYKCFTYPEDYDEKLCEEFINHFTGFAVYIANLTLKLSGRYFGLDLARSAAFEGLFKSYIVCSEIVDCSYERKKGIIKMTVKRCFWSFARIFGFIPSSGQTYFPKGYVDFKDFFREKTIDSTTYHDCDLKIIKELIELLPDRERDIHHLYLAGYDFAEIGRKLGYKTKTSPLQMYKRSIERLKEKI